MSIFGCRPSALFDLDRFPLRPEPAMAALVTLGLLEPSEAHIWLRTLLVDGAAADTDVLHAFLDAIFDSSSVVDPMFDAAIWTQCAQAIAARQAEALVPLLRFFASVFCREPDRIPVSVDDTLSIGLALILDETKMTSPAEHLQYEPFLVRYFAALLIVAMDHRSRGDPAVQAAWRGAIETDPLPDTRRARDIAYRNIIDKASGKTEEF